MKIAFGHNYWIEIFFFSIFSTQFLCEGAQHNLAEIVASIHETLAIKKQKFLICINSVLALKAKRVGT